MASNFPYARYACPCTEDTTAPVYFDSAKDVDGSSSEGRDTDEQTFDPTSPRAAHALYPLEHLLFCSECHEIRCPRCYYEEALHYYCPSCLFEVQSSIVKGESNRCARSCFECPICTAPLSQSAYTSSRDELPREQDSTSHYDGPCILTCQWCSWTSLEVDIIFPKRSNISSQLAKLKLNGTDAEALASDASATQQDLSSAGNELSPFTGAGRIQKSSDQFSQLASFYRHQIAETNPSGPFGFNHNYGLDSPSQLSRLLSTYGVAGLKKQKDQLPIMREAMDALEGIRPELKDDEDDNVIARMRTEGWDGITSVEQRRNQSGNPRFPTDLLPVATKLRSRRAKRCRTCRHILVKLDEKRQRWKHQIKLIAINFVPKIGLRPLDHNVDLESLPPRKTFQLLLTFQNPLFDSVKVTLATPPTTPGVIASKITILCPQFEIGANTDVWDDALDTSNMDRNRARDALEGVQAEAGKIWEKGRNWTSVIMEIVPGHPDSVAKMSDSPKTNESYAADEAIGQSAIEVPLFIRLEYETDDTSGDTLADDSRAKSGKEKRVKRELAYWCVLGAGKIIHSAG